MSETEDDFVDVAIEQFSDEGIGRAIVDFISTGDAAAVLDLVGEAAKRDIAMPVVVVKNEARLYELIAAIAGAIERARGSTPAEYPAPPAVSSPTVDEILRNG